jgi:sirohydrochlorin cobaltochelatase
VSLTGLIGDEERMGTLLNPRGHGMLLGMLQARLKTMLPERYDPSADAVQPVSMGSAGLKFSDDGQVAWHEIWGSFCHLAMGGGPPHRGTLLEPGTPAAVERAPGRYRQAAHEICRGIAMVTSLEAEPARRPGWVRVECGSAGMASWLTRAIVMENVSAHCERAVLFVPAGPNYRLEKEIKNVIVSVAKTRHYWSEHMPALQRQAMAELFLEMDREGPLLQAPWGEHDAEPEDALFAQTARALEQATGLMVSSRRYAGWIGMDCGGVQPAISGMRLLAACNVLARREETVLFAPLNPTADPGCTAVVRALKLVHALALDQATA